MTSLVLSKTGKLFHVLVVITAFKYMVFFQILFPQPPVSRMEEAGAGPAGPGARHVVEPLDVCPSSFPQPIPWGGGVGGCGEVVRACVGI